MRLSNIQKTLFEYFPAIWHITKIADLNKCYMPVRFVLYYEPLSSIVIGSIVHNAYTNTALLHIQNARAVRVVESQEMPSSISVFRYISGSCAQRSALPCYEYHHRSVWMCVSCVCAVWVYVCERVLVSCIITSIRMA